MWRHQHDAWTSDLRALDLSANRGFSDAFVLEWVGLGPFLVSRTHGRWVFVAKALRR